jgi:hypothetical protein
MCVPCDLLVDEQEVMRMKKYTKPEVRPVTASTVLRVMA